MTDSDPDSITISNRSGGADLNAGHDLTIGGDVTGRDKIVSAGGHIIHAGPGATVIVGDTHAAPVSGELPQVDQRDDDKALQEHREYMRERYSTTRLIGKPQPVPIDGIFTDVYLLDRPTAWRRFDLEALEAEHAQRGILSHDGKRRNALNVVRQHNRLFILGKPGAGKTTFLKYLTYQAASSKLDRVPIFISLNEWASSSLQLLPFIQRPFDACDFPDAAAFIQGLLKRGEALICFDGLDEVNEADNQRIAIIRAISDFTNQYPKNKHLITGRIAVTDYTFDKFTYVEMADFTPDQVQAFASKWFGQDEAKAQDFVDELNRDEHLCEMAQTPLLLTLLCWVFGDRSIFPRKRADLYEEALDFLLGTWDKEQKQDLRRNVYRGLSLDHKRQLLARVAMDYFERGEVYFSKRDLAQRVSTFLKTLPDTVDADEQDGLDVIKSIEAQHGLFVERAHGVYSFSHVTLQEYFTARYVADHSSDGAVERLISQHFTDDRWREVFLLTASLLPTEAADAFFDAFQRASGALIHDDEKLLTYERWAAAKAADYVHFGHPAVARTAARIIAVLHAWILAFDFDDPDLDHTLHRAQNRALELARALAIDNHDLYCSIALTLDRATDHTLDVALDTVRSYTRIRDRALNRVRNLDLAHDPGLVLEAYRDRDKALRFDRERAHYLEVALDRARTLVDDLDLDRALDFDRAIIYAALFAQIGSCEGVIQLLPVLSASIARQNLLELQPALNNLQFPSDEAGDAEWKAYAARLRDLLVRYRNLGYEWNFTGEQQRRLDQYEQGTILLVECLQLAAVSDRKAIENRLLLPPED